MGGFATRLGNRLTQASQTPLFGAGAGLLSTGDVGGLLQGMQWANDARTQAEKREREKRLREMIQAGMSQAQTPPQAGGDPWFSPVGAGASVGANLGGSPPSATPPIVAPESVSPMSNVLQAYLQAGDPEQQLMAAQAIHSGYLQEQDWKAQLASDSARERARLEAEDRKLEQQKELELFRTMLKTQYPGAENVPSSVEEYRYWASLSPEDQENYLKVKRGDQGPSSRTEQILYETSDEAVKARANISRYNQLAEKIIEIAPTAGVAGSVIESLKAATGQQDAATQVRKDYIQLRNKAAVQDLPPGIASDKDVSLILEGFLPENANPDTIASFMRGLAKVEEVNAEYQEFKADYIAQNPMRGGVGLNAAWREYAAQRWPGVGSRTSTGVTWRVLDQ